MLNVGDFTITPHGGSHSVEQVGFIVRLKDSFTCDELNDILNSGSVNQLSDFFNIAQKRVKKLPPVKSDSHGKHIGHKQSDESITGLKFERKLQDSEPEWQMLLTKDKIVIYCFKYTRWVHIWPVSYRLLKAIASVLPSKKICNLLLGYLDAFKIEGQGEFDLRELFNPDSEHITRKFFSSDYPVSSRIKYLCDDYFDKFKGNTLIDLSVNCNCHDDYFKFLVDCSFDVEFERYFSLKTLIKSEDKSNRFFKVMDRFHVENKRLLIDVLSSPVQKMIGLVE